MREVIHFSESNVKRGKLIEPLLKYIEGMLKNRLIYKGEANIDVGLPALESRIINFSKCLNLLIPLLHSKGKSSVMNEFYCRLH